jgi:hypothetical protein
MQLDLNLNQLNTCLHSFHAFLRINLILSLYIYIYASRGTEKREDVEGGEEVGSGQKSLEKLRGSPLLLHRRQ